MTLEEQIAVLQAENTELQSHIHVCLKENARLNTTLAASREGAVMIVAALDAAMQLTESLIMFMPDGMVLPPDLGEKKAALDAAMALIGVRK